MVGQDVAALNTNTSTAMSDAHTVKDADEDVCVCVLVLIGRGEESVLGEVCVCVCKDTGWVVHIGLWRVKVRVCAQELRNQGQNQVRMTTTQELQTPGKTGP